MVGSEERDNYITAFHLKTLCKMLYELTPSVVDMSVNHSAMHHICVGIIIREQLLSSHMLKRVRAWCLHLGTRTSCACAWCLHLGTRAFCLVVMETGGFVCVRVRRHCC